ncbi:hypothetical protein, partial [Bacteroides cellulosilyticus]|uniref:hypothetical protein n=1 Tax=Bacteroides cellulosilyticus TaxID=246787 RepID=UPI0032C1690D
FRLYLIPRLSTAPQLPAANGADLRRDSPRLMGVCLPLCRRASGRCIVRLCRASAHSRAPVVAARRGSGRLIRKFPGVGFRLQSGGFRSYSALCPKSLRLMPEVTPALRRLPSGQAQCVPAEDGHNSPRRQSRRLPPPVAGGQDRTPEVDRIFSHIVDKR